MLRSIIAGKIFQSKLWRVVLFLLVLANIAYLWNHPLGWFITLSFFCFVPGYLLLRLLRHTIRSYWETIVFSLGLSILFIMLSGLILNLFYYFGIQTPLTTGGSFLTLSVGTLFLLYFIRRAHVHVPVLNISRKQVIAAILLSLLPLLAAGGAIQLNNGIQSFLPMIVFAAIAIIFLTLVWHERYTRLYPYALFIFALSILLTVSLRGDGVTGHDVLREFHVFQLTMENGFWDIRQFTDPYNACISITILPVIFAKITHIADPYIFKVLFQVIFAFSIIPIYYFMKRIHNAKTAFMGSFLFLSFPTFLNDMPMLNRQEIGLLFFSLLMLLVLTDLPRIQKKVLTILFLVGIILAHYSSGYIVLGLLFVSWLVYLAIVKIYKNRVKEQLTLIFPTLNIVIISTGLLLTFLWNFQITGTTAGLEKTATKTFEGLFEKVQEKSNDVAYSLFGGALQDPNKLLNDHIKQNPGKSLPVEYVPQAAMTLTAAGLIIDKTIDVSALHAFIRNMSAKFIQIMLIVGCVVLAVVYRKRILNQHETYFMALIITSGVLIILQIMLPQLSVDYGTLRLFQQLLVILAIPIVVGIVALFYWAKQLALRFAAIVLTFLFLHLSGFLPQLTGGYPPQLALNNAGFYYDAYYIDTGETKAAHWLTRHNTDNIGVAADPYALLRFNAEARRTMAVTSPFTGSTKAFVYKDRMNKTSDMFMINLNSNLYYYRVKRPEAKENCVYSNTTAEVCKLTKKDIE